MHKHTPHKDTVHVYKGQGKQKQQQFATLFSFGFRFACRRRHRSFCTKVKAVCAKTF